MFCERWERGNDSEKWSALSSSFVPLKKKGHELEMSKLESERGPFALINEKKRNCEEYLRSTKWWNRFCDHTCKTYFQKNHFCPLYSPMSSTAVKRRATPQTGELSAAFTSCYGYTSKKHGTVYSITSLIRLLRSGASEDRKVFPPPKFSRSTMTIDPPVLKIYEADCRADQWLYFMSVKKMYQTY